MVFNKASLHIPPPWWSVGPPRLLMKAAFPVTEKTASPEPQAEAPPCSAVDWRKRAWTSSVWAPSTPAAPHKAGLPEEVGIQPLPQGYHRFTKKQFWVVLNGRLRTHTCHGCQRSPSSVASPGTFGWSWITNMQKASFRIPHHFMSTQFAPI